MKKLVEKIKVEEVENEGFNGLLGEKVTLFCCRYFYAGKLVGVNKEYVKLEDCSFVYDTGKFKESDWASAEALPNDHYVMKQAIESFTVLK